MINALDGQHPSIFRAAAGDVDEAAADAGDTDKDTRNYLKDVWVGNALGNLRFS